MIEATSVSKSFGQGVRAVDKVSFEVQEGSRMILLGPSGCGKTSLLRMINRLIDPDEGSIFFKGKNVREFDLQELRKGIGYVIQQNGLFPHFTVKENISIVPKLLGFSSQKIDSIVHELLVQLRLDPPKILHLLPSQLSGGQQQRVGLARALAGDPPVLLMDEPFGALDTITRSSIVADFMELDVLKSKTIVLVTHDISEAFQLGDTLCILKDGRVQANGTRDEILFKSDNAFLSEFLAKDRLSLELRIITLRDIWEFIPAASFDNERQYVNIRVSSSLETALGQIPTDRKVKGFECINGPERKLFDISGMLDAFHSFKMQKRGAK